MRATVLVEAVLGLGGIRRFSGPRCGMGFGLGISWGCVTLHPIREQRDAAPNTRTGFSDGGELAGPRWGLGFGLGTSWAAQRWARPLSYRMSGKALTEDPVHVPALLLHLPHQGELVPGTVQVVGGVGGAEVHVPV